MNVMARVYGSTILMRGKCLSCGNDCFINIDNLSSCCGSEVKPYLSGRVKTEVARNKIRSRSISVHRRNELLELQEWRCFWCGLLFGEHVRKGNGRVVILRPVWDHYYPFSYTGSCDDREYVAACQICNSIKGAKLITKDFSEEDLRMLIQRRWFEKHHEVIG